MPLVPTLTPVRGPVPAPPPPTGKLSLNPATWAVGSGRATQVRRLTRDVMLTLSASAQLLWVVPAVGPQWVPDQQVSDFPG